MNLSSSKVKNKLVVINIVLIIATVILLAYFVMKKYPELIYKDPKTLCEKTGGSWIECPSVCRGTGLCIAVCGSSFCQR